MITPPSSREEFHGFQSFYENDIEPYLQGKEDARQSAVMHAGLIVIASAVLIGVVLKFGPFGEGNIQASIVSGMLGLAVAGFRVNKTRGDITRGLLERVCGQLKLDYVRDISRPSYCADFDRLGLLPNFNRESWEDEVKGARNGADFVFCEAHLKYKTSGKNSSTRTVFHGQMLVIDYHKKFLGETVIKRDAGLFNRFMKPGKQFQRIGIVSQKFEKIFEAWSTDQVEARELLDPMVLERFEELDRLFNGAKLRAAFSGGKLFLALETGDKLNMGSMFKPLQGPERVEKILKEFDLIYDLIDVLLKRIDKKIDGAFSVDVIREA
ncbi:DUF3137 domain-containing protein [Hyphococcus flavus]|uniref:DUF3137 domain-containing protein n=1 Tax=Hyphococcus flavus TaxID=1866326 RepID=A0AAE9ZAG8_9PROT|nr:DUF3137 domain-containing protein [Hyphococcus flavus]WDI30619.1 DUF3137 domain-containing protein [Hyphococcus flavus]